MKLLSQEPIGVDLFGGAQKRLAEQIVAELIAPAEFCDASGGIHEYSAVLALEGAWGTGKSNVLKMVEETIRHKAPNTTLVRYDVWEHRQELTRKSILEKIVEDLTGATYRLLPKSYREKLYLLTGESVLNYVETTDRYHWIVGILVSALVFVSICKIELLKSPWYLLSALGVTIIGSILYDLFYLKTGFWGALGRLLMAFRIKAPVQYQRRYMHKRDATVSDFRAFIHEISAELGRTRRNENSSRLVIAFDNLDRLSDDEIRDFWASIHVLFAEEKSNRPSNIQIIISYDRKRIRKAFGFSADGDEVIRKTVDIVYSMPEIVVADWAGFLKGRLTDAFDGVDRVLSEDIEQTIKIFNWLHEPDDLVPRAIISFVNELIVINSILDRNATCDGDRVPLPYIALYVLGWRRFEVATTKNKNSECQLAGAVDEIENGWKRMDGDEVERKTAEVINKSTNMIDKKNKDMLIIGGGFIVNKSKAAWKWYMGQIATSSVYMASVVYQLPLSRAKEVLAYQKLGIALDSGDSAYVRNAYTEHGFHEVYSVIIRQVRCFENVAKALVGIKGKDAHVFWDEFYDTRREEIVDSHGTTPSLKSGEKLMIRNMSKWEDFYLRLFKRLVNDNSVIFNENLQTQFARDAEKELNSVGRTLVGIYFGDPARPEVLLKYLRVAKEDYRLLNLSWDDNQLEEYLVSNVRNNDAVNCNGVQYLDATELNKMPRFRAIIFEKQNEVGLPDDMMEIVSRVSEIYHTR